MGVCAHGSHISCGVVSQMLQYVVKDFVEERKDVGVRGWCAGRIDCGTQADRRESYTLYHCGRGSAHTDIQRQFA
jgi:hypothetical protein